MSVRKAKNENGVTYFCTFTCFKWIHLFQIVNFFDAIYNWFLFLNSKKISIVGYVIMPIICMY
ncbi:hypothetical protein BH23BAC1_BH23BAC1_13620 [soil metagenome]